MDPLLGFIPILPMKPEVAQSRNSLLHGLMFVIQSHGVQVCGSPDVAVFLIWLINFFILGPHIFNFQIEIFSYWGHSG